MLNVPNCKLYVYLITVAIVNMFFLYKARFLTKFKCKLLAIHVKKVQPVNTYAYIHMYISKHVFELMQTVGPQRSYIVKFNVKTVRVSCGEYFMHFTNCLFMTRERILI